MHDFRRLRVWQKAFDFAVTIDAVTKTFPRVDRGVVSGQLRRAALSIPANIAEGCGKGSRKDIVRFLQIASGSALEAESHLSMAAELGYLLARRRDELLTEVKAIQRMLMGLMDKVSD